MDMNDSYNYHHGLPGPNLSPPTYKLGKRIEDRVSALEDKLDILIDLCGNGGGLGGGGGGGGGGLSVLSMAQISLYASKKLESNVAQKSYAQFSSIVVPQPASQAARAVAGSMPAMAQT